MKVYQTAQRYYHALPTQEAHFAQLSRGSHRPSATISFGRNLIVITMSTEPLATSTLVSEPDWYMLQIPLSYQGEVIVNGWVHSGNDFYLMCGGKEWITTAQNRKFLLIGIRKEILDLACAALLGRKTECLTLENLQIRSGPDLMYRLKKLGDWVMSASISSAKDGGNL